MRGDQRESGLKARDYLRDLILEKTILLKTIKDKVGKYGRLLGIVMYEGVDINKLLVEEGYAEVYKK